MSRSIMCEMIVVSEKEIVNVRMMDNNILKANSEQ